MLQITPERLKEKLASKEKIFLVDVREPHEHLAFNIGGQLFPLSEIFEYRDAIPRDTEVIVYCKMGIRSQIAIQRLEQRYGFTNLVNLQGGMEAWKKILPR